MRIFYISLIGGLFALTFMAAPLLAQPRAKAIVDSNCSGCHPLKRVYNANKKPGEWEKTVDIMIKKGAKIKPDQKVELIKYLNTLNK